jgi:hypothetical protein
MNFRDPHSVETLERFDQCIDYIRHGKFTEKDVDEAKLATFQKVIFEFEFYFYVYFIISLINRNHLVVRV